MASATRGGRRRPGRLRVGTSGYQYDHWVGVFYPKSLPAPVRWRRPEPDPDGPGRDAGGLRP